MARGSGRSYLCPDFIGRRAERDALRRAMERVTERGGLTVMVAGEAGIGKSRFVDEAVTQFTARPGDSIVLRGHCFETDRHLPYAPVCDLLRGYLAEHQGEGVDELLPRYGSELVKILPDLTLTYPDLEPSPALDPEQERSRLFNVIESFIQDLAGQRRLMVAFEDLHWSDDTSLDLIAHLARWVARVPAMLLLTYRDDEIQPALGRLLGHLERERLALEISLLRLTREDTDAMVAAILDRAGRMPAHLRDRIWSLTEGNPFFIEEVLPTLIAADTGAPNAQDLPIPRTVREAVRQRLDQVSPEARRLATIAAVAGRRFDFGLLARLMDLDEAGMLELLRELLTAQLLVEESADRFAFRHALTREAIHTTLLLRERRALHAEIARTIEEEEAGIDEIRRAELAYHYFEAGVWEKVLENSEYLGAHARALNDAHAAIQHYSRGLTAAAHLALDPPAQLYLSRGQAYAATGAFQAARRDFEAGLRLARTAHDDRASWEALLDLGRLWAERDYAVAGDYFQEAHDLARESSDREMIAHSLNRLGNWHVNAEQPEQGLALHREALEMFRELGDAAGEGETLDLLGMASYLSGDLIGGTQMYRQAGDYFRRMDNRAGLSSSLATLSMRSATLQTNTMAVDDDPLATSAADAEAALGLARQIGWRAGEAYALWMLGFSLGAQGDFRRAFAAASASLELSREISHRQWMTAAECVIGALYLDVLAWEDAQRHFERALRLARDTASRHWIRVASGFLVRALTESGDLKEADQILRDVIADGLPKVTLAQRLVWCAAAELAHRRGQSELALEILDAVLESSPHHERRPVPRPTLLRGRALTDLGHLNRAAAALETIVSTAAAQGARGLEWRSHAALGELAAAQGGSELLTAERNLAKQITSTIEATLDDERLAEQFRSRLEDYLPMARPMTPLQAAKREFDGLTARQREVAILIARGHTNQKIAEQLMVSARTVETHVTNILATLRFASRAQIAAWAVEKGLTGTFNARDR